MWASKCKCMRLGPFSLGSSLGILSALGVLLWGLWMMMHGVQGNMSMADQLASHQSMAIIWVPAIWSLITGFIFGFFLALLYNFFMYCCGMGRKGETCGCCGSCNGSSTGTTSGRYNTTSGSMRNEDDNKTRF